MPVVIDRLPCERSRLRPSVEHRQIQNQTADTPPRWFYSIKQTADMIICRNLENTEQRMRVVFPLRFLHHPMNVQKRGGFA